MKKTTKVQKPAYVAPKGLVLIRHNYQCDPEHPMSKHTVVLVLSLEGRAIADVVIEFKAAPTGNPHEDRRDYCQISAGLTDRGAGLVDVTTAFKAINIALETVDCSSFDSIVAEYVTRGTFSPFSHGYITIDPSLYNIL